MNTLIVSDVFDAYYDGRKGGFPSEQPKSADAEKRDGKIRAEAANADRRVPKAA